MNRPMLSESTARKVRNFRLEARSILLISAGVAGLVLVFVILSAKIGLVHHQAQSDASAKVNALGCAVLSFADSTVQRSEANLIAVQHSPTSSVLLKLTTKKNLANLKVIQADAHAKIKVSNCPKVRGLGNGKANGETNRNGEGTNTTPRITVPSSSSRVP